MDGRRRPASLQDAAFCRKELVEENNHRPPLPSDASIEAKTKQSPMIGLGGSTSTTRLAADVQRCVRSLRAELEGCIMRHQEEIDRVVERQNALLSAGWRSAPSDGHDFQQRFQSALAPPSGTRLPPIDHPATVAVSGSRQFSKSDEADTVPFLTDGVVIGRPSEVDLCTSTPVDSANIPPRPPSGPPLAPMPPPGSSPSLGTCVSGELSCLSASSVTLGSCSEDSELRTRTSRVSKIVGSRWSVNGTPTNLYTPVCKKRRRDLLIVSDTPISNLVHSQGYEISSAALIVLNAIFVVWETQRWSRLAAAEATSVQIYHDDLYFQLAANFFCAVFVLDLVLRALAGRMRFLFSKDWAWNLFDTFVVSTAVLEVAVQWWTYASPEPPTWRMALRKLSMMRVLRLLRVVRLARTMKFIKFISELRLMVLFLTSSLKPLAWSVVLMAIILLVFGIYFTDGAIAYCTQHGMMQAEATAELRSSFGTVSASTLSLFMAMSGGEDWAHFLTLLAPLPMEYSLLFLAFVTFAILALLNVVTAVFINAALQRSQNDRELAVQQELESKDELVSVIQEVFMELDTNQSGSLTIEEFQKHIEDDKIQAIFRSRQIDLGQVQTLFFLLDVDETGDVDMEEFVQGVLRLKGGATSMDLAVLTYRVEHILHRIQALNNIIAQFLPVAGEQA